MSIEESYLYMSILRPGRLDAKAVIEGSVAQGHSLSQPSSIFYLFEKYGGVSFRSTSEYGQCRES